MLCDANVTPLVTTHPLPFISKNDTSFAFIPHQILLCRNVRGQTIYLAVNMHTQVWRQSHAQRLTKRKCKGHHG